MLMIGDDVLISGLQEVLRPGCFSPLLGCGH
jgi:hypothetical protein